MTYTELSFGCVLVRQNLLGRCHDIHRGASWLCLSKTYWVVVITYTELSLGCVLVRQDLLGRCHDIHRGASWLCLNKTRPTGSLS